jgi:hypothetical protein
MFHTTSRFFPVLGSPRPTRSISTTFANLPGFAIIGAHDMTHPPFGMVDRPRTHHRHVELSFDLIEESLRMRQSGANCSLRSNSLIIRENAGNFRDFAGSDNKNQPRMPRHRWRFCQNSPTQPNRELYLEAPR